MPRMGLAEHPSVREGPARKEPRSQGSAPRLRERVGGVWGGGRGLAPAGLPQPKPLGWGGVWLVTDRGLEMQTNSEKRADSVTETQIYASTDGGGRML